MRTFAIMPLSDLKFSEPISGYMYKAAENYQIALDHLDSEPAANGIQAVARFHYLRLDQITGKPMIKPLVDLLYNQLAEYCLKAGRVESARGSQEHIALLTEAKNLLRKHQRGGEVGEILAYFLIEAILGAPQLVAKIDLKTNTRVESLGADGLHFRWNEMDQSLDIFCAEAKLETQPSSAIANIAKSIKKFHLKKDYENEFRLATAHFKHSSEALREAVTRVLQNKEPTVTYRLRHACLAGYQWNGYSNLAGSDIRIHAAEFKERYLKQRARLHKLIQGHIPGVEKAVGPLIHFDIFFLPFESVQEFRDTFNSMVGLTPN